MTKGVYKSKPKNKKKGADYKKRTGEFITKVLDGGTRKIQQDFFIGLGFRRDAMQMFSTNALGVVPRYDPAGTTIELNTDTSRMSSKLYFKSMKIYLTSVNTSAYAQCLRLIIFRNNNPLEVLTPTTLANIFQSANGNDEAPNVNPISLPNQKFNMNLVTNSKDLKLDKLITVNSTQVPLYDSADNLFYNHSASNFGTIYRKHININEVINYENDSLGTQVKSGYYQLALIACNNKNDTEPPGTSCEVGLRVSCTFYEA